MFCYRKLILKEGFKIENKICTCFGHRETYKDFSRVLSELLEDLILNQGVVEFWTGGMGNFDGSFSAAVRGLKRKYPDIKLILIKPYFSNELNTNKEYYEYTYDDVVIPDILAGVHPKSAITKRNRWMVENSDFIVTYVRRDHGGAFEAKKYAAKLDKVIFETNDMLV
ncbi:MAG: DUF1273 family protein [Oscillospiraceae bacterium]|nr:DUF1273 family protein [Oscillospiraceae bacterium]